MSPCVLPHLRRHAATPGVIAWPGNVSNELRSLEPPAAFDDLERAAQARFPE